MVEEILAKYLTKNFSKIRFGGGVVSITSWVIVTFFVSVVYLASTLQNQWIILGVIIAIMGIFLYYLRTILSFAEKNPQIAALSGMELVAYKQMEATQKHCDNTTNSNTNTDGSKDGILHLDDVKKHDDK